MATKLLVKEGSENATLTLQSSPSFVVISGSEELKSDIEFESKFAYDSVGHIMNLGNIFAQDLYIFMVDLYGKENVEILEGKEEIKDDDKELAILEKNGVT
mgnify:CR=1 FL=1|tara:strand:- start:208 stop:510 length:303 start_codon:yes stop_codon:yes gene_type:complete